jgi:hypothetical protein
MEARPRGSSITEPPQSPALPDVQFVNSVPEDLVCGICLAAAQDAVVTEECGHLFCRDCITQAMVRKKECPVDRTPLSLDHIHKDVRSQRKIKELVVFCPQKGLGCAWTGAYSDVERHVPKCEFTAVACPFESHGCNVQCSRKQLGEHINTGSQHHLVLLCASMIRMQEDMLTLTQQLEIHSRHEKQYIWVIPGFDTKRGPVYSPKFMQRGFMWYLGVDSEGPDQHAGVYLFAEGHNRRVDFKLTLFHSEESRDKVHMVSDWRKDYKGKGWGPLKFIDRANLASSGFVSNGCIRVGLRMECDAYD